MLAATDLDVAQNVAFGIIAAAMALGAIGVVRTKNVVHAALYLVVVLAGGAAQFILLGQWMETVPDFEAYEAGSQAKVKKVPR